MDKLYILGKQDREDGLVEFMGVFNSMRSLNDFASSTQLEVQYDWVYRACVLNDPYATHNTDRQWWSI